HRPPDCTYRGGDRRPAGANRRNAVARVRSAAGHRVLAGSNRGLLRSPTLLAACRRNCIRDDRIGCAHIRAGFLPCIHWPSGGFISVGGGFGRPPVSAVAIVAISGRPDRRSSMIWNKIIFGGLGRRGFEAVVAGLVLAAASALVGGSLLAAASPASL